MRDSLGPKERIIKKAISLFYTQGVHGTGINQIIDESMVAKASFYHHFKSKDDLVVETIYSFRDIVLERTRKIIIRSNTPEEFIAQWAGVLKRDISSSSYFGCPLANIAFDAPSTGLKMQQDLAGVMDEVIVMISDFFHAMQVKGELPDDIDTLQLAKRFLHMYEGALTMWKITGDPSFVDDLEYLLKMIIAG